MQFIIFLAKKIFLQKSNKKISPFGQKLEGVFSPPRAR